MKRTSEESAEKRVQTLTRRLERERAARREAEAIAERVTSELYASKQEILRVNDELRGINEELASLNTSLRDFVAVASHDLRSPISSIISASSILASGWRNLEEAELLELLAIVERQSAHAMRMMDELLTLSRIESGGLDTQAGVVRVREALDDVVKEFARELPVQVSIEPEDVEVVVDPDHLTRILVNFLGNAVKYGDPPLEVEVCSDGEWVNIVVCDNGEGIPDELTPRLFQKFARGLGARAKGGTGLGLSIVRGLAAANRGEAWYEPNSPQGARFGVRLPRHVA